MPYERSYEPVLPANLWWWRVYRSVGLAVIVVAVALTVGVLGYHYLGHIAWIDSLLEASMILGGMGAIAQMTNNAVKIFASIYALCSGLMLITVTGILLGPWVHRMMHKFHAEQEDDKKKNKK